jgi:hypothetical protein
MESYWLIGKLAKWAFILHEYDFDIIHKASKVIWDVDGLSWNPRSNEKDTMHVSAYNYYCHHTSNT